jgi:hypothetical protein
MKTTYKTWAAKTEKGKTGNMRENRREYETSTLN